MKFTVNNQEWELVLVKPNSKELVRSNGTITIGMTDNNQKGALTELQCELFFLSQKI